MTDEDLIEAALAARERAHAPYSKFRVGAAALDADGAVYSGCNVENASYGLTICAERNALGGAVVGGAAEIVALAVVADTQGPVRPCGACRQVMLELAPRARVVMANLTGRSDTVPVPDLLPKHFEF